MSKKLLAIEILASNPSMAEVFITEDNQAFAKLGAAIAHNTSKGVNFHEVKPECFTAEKLKAEVASAAKELAAADAAAKEYAAKLAASQAAAKLAAKEVMAASAKELEPAESKTKGK